MLQSTLNQQMLEEGRSRFHKAIESARARGLESATQHGMCIISGAVPGVSDAIQEWMREAKDNKRGPRHAALPYIKDVLPAVSAFITSRVVLDCVALSKSYTRTCLDVAGALEDEVRVAWLRKHHKGLFHTLRGKLERCGSYDHKRTVIVHAMNKMGLSKSRACKIAGTGDVFKPWETGIKVQVGAVLVDCFQRITGLFTTIEVHRGKKTELTLRFTEKATAFIQEFTARNEVLHPVWMPMVEPPEDWTAPRSGGYDARQLPIAGLVKKGFGAYNKILSSADMPEVYEGINALQRTAWKINTRVLGIMEHLWSNVRRGVGSLPAHDGMELPPKPHDINTNEEARKEYTHAAARVYEYNNALRSQRLAAGKTLSMARKFRNEAKIYFPYQLDFRGRVYSVPSFLSPQGNDVSRSLLLFAEGVPMFTEEDAYWLAVAGANLWGNDKVTFEERVQWVRDNEASILSVAADPLSTDWWQQADGGDSAWQFLAWCFEWAGWKKTGPGFTTHLPVCLDGTNNGLQILSMLTRDEDAAKATNVLPGDKPEDIYAEVARRAVETMRTEAHYSPEGSDERAHAACWIDFGINRKTTKRPVMVLPYGGKFHSCREYIMEWYRTQCAARGIELERGAAPFARVNYLASKVWEAIDFCVTRPRKAMEWFQQCADVFTRAGKGVTWVTPTGFPVVQAYKETESYRVSAMLSGSIRVRPCLEKETPQLSRARQRNGISPNFVHSLDAAALCKTISYCLKHGIKSYCMIHDSYGTHAPYVHQMAASLRHAFVDIFSKDQLTNLRDQWVKQLEGVEGAEVLPPVPEMGELDIQSLHDSEFFFA